MVSGQGEVAGASGQARWLSEPAGWVLCSSKATVRSLFLGGASGGASRQVRPLARLWSVGLQAKSPGSAVPRVGFYHSAWLRAGLNNCSWSGGPRLC